MNTTVLVVEDEPAIQELLAATLIRAGYDVQRAPDANIAMESLHNSLPDMILLDWMLPGRSGLAFARELRNNPRTKTVPIIMVTARAEEENKVAGLEQGVDDYITKPFSPRELLARVKAVLRRRAPHSTDDAVKIGSLVLDPVSHRVYVGDSSLHIGPTEFRLLHFLMTHPDRVYSRAQLLDQVWGDHVFLEERTVDVHIRRLRLALQSDGHDKLIRTVRGSGYLLAGRLPG
ncbi:MAG TPA: phosphate regulon transcriptional regulator PhoB [Burkholderiales bacterium]|nr:phosphate regulon transcriptional regulator PhoB [Burkholderiales bacterium]